MNHKIAVARAGLGMLLAGLLAAPAVQAQSATQKYPVTPAQRATAEQVASAGVPLADLAPNAPERYTVRRGDTLWAISGLFLKTPWRWPELWGMNRNDIRNPHLIYPGQLLVLEKIGDRARLRFGDASQPGSAPSDVVKLSPRVRTETLLDPSIPTLRPGDIESFLAEPIVVDEGTLERAPRIVATQEGRVLLSRGDRAYIRSSGGAAVDANAVAKTRFYRVFRNATPLKDPTTGELLGYEAQFVGRAELVRPENASELAGADAPRGTDIVPATIDIIGTKEEMRVGDRLLPEPPRQFDNYVPRAPGKPTQGQVVSVYGNTVAFAAQSQVVTINRGQRDGIEPGHVLALLSDGARLIDRTDPAKPEIKLPDERNGLAMVFRTFERVSYALVLQIGTGVKVGDRVVNPR